MKKTGYKKHIIILMSVVLAAALIVNLSLALLVAKRNRDNVFSLGNVRLTLTEDDFPDDRQDRTMPPKSIVPKNPKIINVGLSDAYVFMRVTVPLYEVQLIDETTNKPVGERTLREVYDLLSDDASAGTVHLNPGYTIGETGRFDYHSKWVFLRSEVNAEKHTHSYLFGYGAKLDGKSNAETATLFDRLQLRNILEGELPKNVAEYVSVSAFGIQADNILNDVHVNDTSSLSEAELKAILSIYEKQEEA